MKFPRRPKLNKLIVLLALVPALTLTALLSVAAPALTLRADDFCDLNAGRLYDTIKENKGKKLINSLPVKTGAEIFSREQPLFGNLNFAEGPIDQLNGAKTSAAGIFRHERTDYGWLIHVVVYSTNNKGSYFVAKLDAKLTLGANCGAEDDDPWFLMFVFDNVRNFAHDAAASTVDDDNCIPCPDDE